MDINIGLILLALTLVVILNTIGIAYLMFRKPVEIVSGSVNTANDIPLQIVPKSEEKTYIQEVIESGRMTPGIEANLEQIAFRHIDTPDVLGGEIDT